MTVTSGREAFTIEIAVSAAGDVLDPMVLLKGKYGWTNWHNPAYKNQMDVTPNGWMTAECFHNWFKNFAETVTERPLLLICDGHSSHLLQHTEVGKLRKLSEFTNDYC